MPSYTSPWKFSLFLHTIILLSIVANITYNYSIYSQVRSQIKYNIIYPTRHAIPGINYLPNTRIIKTSLILLTVMVLAAWLSCLLIIAGDVHPNPGPSSTHSTSSTCSSFPSMSQSLSDLMSKTNCLSSLHYNVQSLLNKVEVLEAEFSSFDIISFSETWLNSNISNDDLKFSEFHFPERKV